MLVGWDYVSKLQLPTSLLFISQVIYENGEPRWNDIDRENSWSVHQSSLAILPTSSSSKSERTWRRKLRIWSSKYLCSYFVVIFTCYKISHVTGGFTSPPKERVLRILITLKNPLPRPGLNPRTLDPVARMITANHCITEVTWNTASSSTSIPKDINHLLGTTEIRYSLYKITPLNSVLSHTNPIHILIHNFFNVYLLLYFHVRTNISISVFSSYIPTKIVFPFITKTMRIIMSSHLPWLS
jgi:hypothetical protein